MANRSTLKEGITIRGLSRYRLWACRGVLVGASLALVGALVVFTGMVVASTFSYSDYILRALEGPLAADDPELLRYIQEELLRAPSSKPYNILGDKNIANRDYEESEIFYNESLRVLFKDKHGGFFVEAGALDGESMSNTLWLEQEAAWTGLLVEPDVPNYLSLVSKHRRSWSANVCLSPNSYPSKEMLTIMPHFPGPMAVALGFKTRAMHSLTHYASDRVNGNSWFQKVQCIPLESLLLAMGVTRVDLLSLDVEGAELAILDHFDLKKFDVQVLCIEWKKMHELDDVARNLSSRGYVEVARKLEDLILVKKGSEYEARLRKTPHT
ncbi:uncharacterized protein [Procambarus clarkii]|uniref:uncharacterized protein isoform X3 n=1 Tax=Procambarus clarkii TaxID=6728 RepID=UPI0037425232